MKRTIVLTIILSALLLASSAFAAGNDLAGTSWNLPDTTLNLRIGSGCFGGWLPGCIGEAYIDDGAKLTYAGPVNTMPMLGQYALIRKGNTLYIFDTSTRTVIYALEYRDPCLGFNPPVGMCADGR